MAGRGRGPVRFWVRMDTPFRPHLLETTHADTTAKDAVRAWALHSFTGLGVVVGLFALTAVFSGHPAAAVGWMLVAVLMDGLDGPLARSWGVAEALPEIDGCTLDTVVDYFNCVVVPVASSNAMAAPIRPGSPVGVHVSWGPVDALA